MLKLKEKRKSHKYLIINLLHIYFGQPRLRGLEIMATNDFYKRWACPRPSVSGIDPQGPRRRQTGLFKRDIVRYSRFRVV